MKETTATQAARNMRAMLEAVARGERFILTKHGRPVAMVTQPEICRDETFHDGQYRYKVFSWEDGCMSLLTVSEKWP